MSDHDRVSVPFGTGGRRRFVATALGACGLAAVSPLLGSRTAFAAGRTRELAPFTYAEIEARAAALGRDLGLDVGKRQEVGKRLRKLLWGKKFQSVLENPGITGVAAYRGGGGGLLVRFSKARGLMAFRHQDPNAPTRFEMQFTSFGAHIGGSGDWGVLLLAGLREEAGFGGRYRASMTKAAAAETSTKGRQLMFRSDALEARHAHDVYVVSSARGLSADAGGGFVKIKVLDENAPSDDDSKDRRVDVDARVSAKPRRRGT